MKMTRALIAGAVLGLGIAVGSAAQAAFIATMTEVGLDVTLSGSGTINTAGFISPGYGVTGGPPGVIAPTSGFMIGVPSVQYVDYYSPFSGPATFGSGSFTSATSGSGDRVGLRTDAPNAGIAVPLGYHSGDFLSSSSTYANATFISLGVTPGSYMWTWGNGATADSFTLNITDAVPTPEPGSLALLATACVGIALKRRRKAA